MALRGFDIRDCDDPDSSFTLRRLYVIYSSLPNRCELNRKISGQTLEEHMWGVSEYVLANVFDAIQSLTYLTQVINTPKGKPPPKQPKRHPRPSDRNAARPRPRDWFPGKTIVQR